MLGCRYYWSSCLPNLTRKEMKMTRYFSHKRLVICLLLILAATFIGFSVFSMDDPVYVKSDPQQPIGPIFRLFETKNSWNFLLLDTRNGRVWQVQYATNSAPEFAIHINNKVLSESFAGRTGRFTLYPTRHVWTYLLLDQDDGRTFQIHYSNKSDENRFIKRIL